MADIRVRSGGTPEPLRPSGGNKSKMLMESVRLTSEAAGNLVLGQGHADLDGRVSLNFEDPGVGAVAKRHHLY